MDHNSPDKSKTSALAAQSAAAVRALRDRAQRALEEREQRLVELEERIAAQLAMIGEEIARDAENTPAGPSLAELEALTAQRSEFERERSDWETCRERQEAELITARQAVELTSTELNGKLASLDDREAKINAQQEQLAVDLSEIANQREGLQRERAELEDAVKHFKQEQESTAQSDHEELNQLKQRLESERASWQSERKQLEATLQEQAGELEGLRQELERTTQQHRELVESAKDDEATARKELAAQAAEWHRERSQLKDEHNSLSEELQGIRRKFEQSRQQEAAASQELEEVVAKFKLAMEDVRRLRARVLELEQELANRPAVDLRELPEWIELKKERNQLVEQIKTLESRLESENDASAEQEIQDLRRRFELAVEDVRQLKTEKSKLEEQLASARRSPTAAVESPLSDWEAQKRLLLASLEGEDTPTPERRKELTSIEGTIRITDEVVAEKDRELEALRQRIQESGSRSSDEEAVDVDELICAERARLAAMEAELNEKLRAAELELSTSRAKLARQEAELENLRCELETFKQAGPIPGSPSGAGQAPPRRRWLDKLGLGGEEE